MGYTLTKKEPAVSPISVHLPFTHTNQQYHRRHANSSEMSTLNHYFCRPSGTFFHHDVSHQFCDLTYVDYYSLFRLQKVNANHALLANRFTEQPNEFDVPPMQVILRTDVHRHLGRIHDIPPSRGEVFYLRALLQHRPARSFEDVRTVDGTIYDSYQEAAVELGLFANEREAEYALFEGIRNLKTPHQLRLLFVHLLVNDCVPTPMMLWDKIAHHLALDYTLRNNNMPTIGVEHTLCRLGECLEEYGKTLSDYGLPEPISYGREVEHELARWNVNPTALATEADATYDIFNTEQRIIYDTIVGAISSGTGLVAFVDGKAGRGKTTVLNAVCQKARSMGRIVLPTAIAAFAAQQYAGGRTTHSAFKVCNQLLAHLIIQTQPIKKGARERRRRRSRISHSS
jgi:PIF1-like helicase